MPSGGLAASLRPSGSRLLRPASALVCGVLLFLAHVPAASAQPNETFQGSEIRRPFEFGITASASAYKLRILARRGAVEKFLAVNLPDPEQGAADYAFNLIIEPMSSNPVRCNALSDTPAALKLCFDASNPIRMGEWDVIQKPGFSPEMVVDFAFRRTADPTKFATCGMVRSKRELFGCTFFFEERGLVHKLDAPTVALKQFGVFDCAALKLRNAVWPAAPEIPESCRKNP